MRRWSPEHSAAILVARGVPASSLPPALELLAGELRDFDRAARLLDTALTTLAAGERLHRPGRPP